MSSAAAAHQRAFGLDRGLPFPLEDVPRTGCVILVGSNLAETMPPALRYLTELKANGGTLIVVDPRRTRTAEQADLHLAPRPGTDLALALGLLHLVVAEGRTDEEFIAARTTGWEEARAAAMAHWPELVERITGVPVPRLREAVGMFCDAPSAMVLTARGPEQQSKGTDTVGAWINLCLATGRAAAPVRLRLPHRPGQRPGRPRARPEGRPAPRVPQTHRPGGPRARRGGLGVDPETLPGPGRSAYELLDALGTDVRALLLMGSNPVVSAPRAVHVEERVRALDFLAVADVVLSETAALADVVLPVTQWAEETGTTTSLEGRVLLRRRALTPPPGVRSDLEVLHGLAARLGVEKGFPADPEEVFEELRRASAGRRPTTPASPTPASKPNRASSGPAPRARRESPGSSWTASPPTTAGPGSCPSPTGMPPRPPTPTTPCCSPPAGSSPSTSPAPRPAGCPSSTPPRPAPSWNSTRAWPPASG